MILALTSKNNPKVQKALKLKEKKYRQLEHLFLAEGYKALEMALEVKAVKEVYALEYIELPEDIDLYLVNEDILKKLSSSVHPEGVVFIAKELDYTGRDFHKILYLDNINDPGNMGTLIRTALAFSYDAVIASKESVSFYNEKVINSSKGAIFKMPVLNEDFDKIYKDKKVIVTLLDKTSIPLEEVAIKDDFVLVLGSESHGVSEKIIAKADYKVIIPISNIDSLNVAVAGGILMNKIH